jgi:DEAD/DEAH box helicase
MQALCLAPSRELARQIMSVVVSMGKFTPVQTEYAIKDHLPRTASSITAHVVVGTPGTMTDLLRRKVIDSSEVKVFVCDEADNMLDQDGLGDQTLRVKKWAPFPFCAAEFGLMEMMKYATAVPSGPNSSFLCYFPRSRPKFRLQVRPQCQQD